MLGLRFVTFVLDFFEEFVFELSAFVFTDFISAPSLKIIETSFLEKSFHFIKYGVNLTFVHWFCIFSQIMINLNTKGI